MQALCEISNCNEFINELVTLENGEVANMQRLKAAYALFTALEYSTDPVEILNEHFKLLVRLNSKKFRNDFFIN